MSAGLTEPPLTFEAYMAWEAEQPERHEFFAGEVVAITGARATHNTIAGNVFLLLKQSLRGTPCRIFFADMKLHVASADASFYPDVFVSCDPRDRTPDAELVQRHPQLVVEVLSDSTAASTGRQCSHTAPFAEGDRGQGGGHRPSAANAIRTAQATARRCRRAAGVRGRPRGAR